MRPTTGTCQRCRREHPLDDGRHVSEHPLHPLVERSIRCSGSGKLSTQARDANAAKSRERTMARLDQLRADAAVAHDAIATGYPWPAHQLLAMRKAALQEYRIKFPKVRTQRIWFFASRGRRRRRSSWLPETCDVYCTLCRELILPLANRGVDHTERTREHTTMCALRCLAGLAEYVDPKERRLPAETMPEPIAEEF